MIFATMPSIGIFGRLKRDSMVKQKIAILGCTGMLGSITLNFFSKSNEYAVIATHRSKTNTGDLRSRYPDVIFRTLDAEQNDSESIIDAIDGADWIINAIGIIKPYIRDDSAGDVERAVRVNSLFPLQLARVAKTKGARIIHITTDCVFSGKRGKYTETDEHDVVNVYGKTKSLGEIFSDNVYNIRTSIIGPERKSHKSLMDWLLNQPPGSKINGFTNHHWNGITTLHFARICQGIIKKGLPISNVQHIVPANLTTKAGLIKNLAKEFKRQDITIRDTRSPEFINRTLSTNNQKLNDMIWSAAGYSKPPTIEQMIAELAKYSFASEGTSR